MKKILVVLVLLGLSCTYPKFDPFVKITNHSSFSVSGLYADGGDNLIVTPVEKGEYLLIDVPEGDYEIEIEVTGHPDDGITFTRDFQKDYHFDITITETDLTYKDYVYED